MDIPCKVLLTFYFYSTLEKYKVIEIWFLLFKKEGGNDISIGVWAKLKRMPANDKDELFRIQLWK